MIGGGLLALLGVAIIALSPDQARSNTAANP